MCNFENESLYWSFNFVSSIFPHLIWRVAALFFRRSIQEAFAACRNRKHCLLVNYNVSRWKDPDFAVRVFFIILQPAAAADNLTPKRRREEKNPFDQERTMPFIFTFKSMNSVKTRADFTCAHFLVKRNRLLPSAMRIDEKGRNVCLCLSMPFIGYVRTIKSHSRRTNPAGQSAFRKKSFSYFDKLQNA